MKNILSIYMKLDKEFNQKGDYKGQHMQKISKT